MAIYACLVGFDARTGERTFEKEVHWWNGLEAACDPRAVRDGRPPKFVDWYIDLTPSEARAFHEARRARAYEYGYKFDGWPERIAREMAALDAVLIERAAAFGRFRVELFDWSGAD